MVGVYDVVTTNAGLICTEIHDANPVDETQVYDLVGIDWVAQP